MARAYPKLVELVKRAYLSGYSQACEDNRCVCVVEEMYWKWNESFTSEKLQTLTTEREDGE